MYTPNNFNNRVVGPPKGKIFEGQPPRYSNVQQKFLKLFIQNSNELLEQENLPTPPLPNSSSWLFNPSTQPTTNPVFSSSLQCNAPRYWHIRLYGPQQ